MVYNGLKFLILVSTYLRYVVAVFKQIKNKSNSTAGAVRDEANLQGYPIEMRSIIVNDCILDHTIENN